MGISTRYCEKKAKKEKQVNLRSALKRHQLWLDGKPGGERLDLSGEDLSKSRATWTGLTFDGVTFDRANMNGLDLSKTTFIDCEFNEATLVRTHLDGTKFINCVMK